MPFRVRLYIGIAVMAGSLLLGGGLTWHPRFPEIARFLAYVSLACIASTLKVQLPRLQGTMSVNFVFVLMSIAQLSLAETFILGLAATVVQCCWRSKTRPKLIQVLFSSSAVVISAALAYGTARAIPGEPPMLMALIPAATVYFVSNTGMVSLVIALLSNRSLSAVWRQCHLWTFPFYLVGAAIAATASASGAGGAGFGWRLALLALPLMYLVYTHYRIYLSSQTPG